MYHLIDISQHETVFIELTSQDTLLLEYNEERIEAGLPLVESIRGDVPIPPSILPGSLDRQQVYRARYDSGMPLWNSEDAFLYGS